MLCCSPGRIRLTGLVLKGLYLEENDFFRGHHDGKRQSRIVFDGGLRVPGRTGKEPVVFLNRVSKRRSELLPDDHACVPRRCVCDRCLSESINASRIRLFFFNRRQSRIVFDGGLRVPGRTGKEPVVFLNRVSKRRSELLPDDHACVPRRCVCDRCPSDSTSANRIRLIFFDRFIAPQRRRASVFYSMLRSKRGRLGRLINAFVSLMLLFCISSQINASPAHQPHDDRWIEIGG